MTKIESEQAKFLKDLKELIGKKVQILDKVFILAVDNFCAVKIEGENIIELTICHYKLTTLPESISNLKSLQTLVLYKNSLKELPKSICELKTLKTLWLQGQLLSTLPDSIGNLHSLQKLVVSNQLKSVPDSIGNLRSLRELLLAYNKLTSLPESIGNLDSLEILSLHKNQLRTLPISLWKLKKLTELRLQDNPWVPEWKQFEFGFESVPRILELWQHRAPIVVFISFSPLDEIYPINTMIDGLKSCKEIEEVYIKGESEIMHSHLFLFIASKNSINNEECQQELITAIKNNNNIIPIKAPDIKWEDLNNINLGMSYNISEKLGIEFNTEDNEFYKTLYHHIIKYKNQVNLLEPLEARIDKQWLNAKIISENFLNSEEFNKIYMKNKDHFKELAEKLRNGQLSPKDYIAKTGQLFR